MKIFSLPEKIENQIKTSLLSFDLDVSEYKSQKKIAECILRLSDYFIDQPEGATPWKESWTQIAYISYFLPLNYLRVQRVIEEGKKTGFFDGLEQIIDFGAGLGTASIAFDVHLNKNISKILIEQGEPAKNLSQKFFRLDNSSWFHKFQNDSIKNPSKTLTCFSYSLTEILNLPDWSLNNEGIMIVEPSTQEDGRPLLELRKKLIESGWTIYGPCTHQKNCPLLEESKRDWCHDRIHIQLPEWMTKVEDHLPMTNATLTTSYLLARKNKTHLKAEISTKTRTVGDLLKEKGKDRQLICNGPERKFLAWMHKYGNTLEIPRGELISLPESIQVVANELRVLPSKQECKS